MEEMDGKPGREEGNPVWYLMTDAQVAQVKATSYLIAIYGWDDDSWKCMSARHRAIALNIYEESNLINTRHSVKSRIKEWNSAANGDKMPYLDPDIANWHDLFRAANEFFEENRTKREDAMMKYEYTENVILYKRPYDSDESTDEDGNTEERKEERDERREHRENAKRDVGSAYARGFEKGKAKGGGFVGNANGKGVRRTGRPDGSATGGETGKSWKYEDDTKTKGWKPYDGKGENERKQGNPSGKISTGHHRNHGNQ